MHGCIGRGGQSVLRFRMTAALLAAGFLLGVAAQFAPAVCIVLLCLLLCVYLLLTVFWLPRWCKAAQYLADSRSILLRRGVFFTRSVILSRAKIRYAVVGSTPLQRLFGVVDLRLMTAGGQVVVPQLALPEANRLTAFLRLPTPETDAGRREP